MSEPNLLDRAISAISPAAGLARMRNRVAMATYGAYTAGSYTRRELKSWTVTRGSADADTLFDLPTIRQRSRDLVRNAPIAGGAIHTVVANAVGTGLALQPTPDITILDWTEDQARVWGASVGHEFGLWADSTDCDITRTNTFYEIQALVVRSYLESGDVFALLPQKAVKGLPYKTRIQLIEADRVASPMGDGNTVALLTPGAAGQKFGSTLPASSGKIFGGVEVDDVGAPVAYCILKNHPGGLGFVASNLSFDRVLAFGAVSGRRNVIHVFDRLRPDQNRGVPYLAPVVESLKMIDRYREAELMATVVSAMFTVFVKSDTGSVGLPSEAPAGAPIIPNDVALGNGAIVGLGDNQDVSFANPSRPNSGYDAFVLSILREVGVSLQLPLEVLMKHFTSSYSAARAAFLEAWKFYRNRRAFVAARFCQPVFEAWMDEAVSMGRIQAPGYFSDSLMRRAYLRADWVGDAPGQIDPQKEIGAANERVQMGVSTLKIETMAMSGLDYDDLVPQRIREHEVRAAAGLEPGVSNVTASTEMVTPPGQDPVQPAALPPGEPQPAQPAVKPKPVVKPKGGKL